MAKSRSPFVPYETMELKSVATYEDSRYMLGRMARQAPKALPGFVIRCAGGDFDDARQRLMEATEVMDGFVLPQATSRIIKPVGIGLRTPKPQLGSRHVVNEPNADPDQPDKLGFRLAHVTNGAAVVTIFRSGPRAVGLAATSADGRVTLPPEVCNAFEQGLVDPDWTESMVPRSDPDMPLVACIAKIGLYDMGVYAASGYIVSAANPTQVPAHITLGQGLVNRVV